MKRILISLIVLLIGITAAAAVADKEHSSSGSIEVITDENFNLEVKVSVVNASKKYNITTVECIMIYNNGGYGIYPTRRWEDVQIKKMSLEPGKEQSFSFVFYETVNGLKAKEARISRIRFSDGYVYDPGASYYFPESLPSNPHPEHPIILEKQFE